MKKTLVFFIGFLLPSFSAIAQPNTRIYTGDQLSDLDLGTLLNNVGKTEKVKLSDYKGRLVILDFWNTHCGPCVKALPKLDSLQKLYGDKIVILPVTFQKKDAVMEFIARQKTRGIALQLPTIIDDTVLSKRFPHISVPHEVWIGLKGEVIAQTKEYIVTASNIARVLAGNTGAIQDREAFTGFDPRKGVFLNQGSLTDSSVLFQRLITGAVSEGSTGGVGNGLVAGGKAFRFYVWNQPAHLLYNLAYSLSSPAQINWDSINNKSLYKLPDSIDYYKDAIAYTKWAIRNLYCYELILPIPDSLKNKGSNKIREAMTPIFKTYLQNDLDMFFRLRAEYTLKETPALVLKGELVGGGQEGRRLSARSIAAWINRQYGAANGMIVFNEVRLPDKTAKVMLSDSAFNNFTQLHKELKAIGLTLSKEMRKTPMLMLYEIN